MDTSEQVRRLVRLQEIALEIRSAQTVLDEAPARVEEIENRFRERNAEYVAVKDRYDELASDQSSREIRVKDLEEQKTKYKDQLMQVKNQREYTAVLQEIDNVATEISNNEEAVLKSMDELQTLKGELDTHEEHIKAERERVETERTDVESSVSQAQATLEELGAKRTELESALPPAVKASVATLEQSRQGVFLARVDNGTCSACFVRVRPQVVQEIKKATKLHTCDSCRRFLYHERLIEMPASMDVRPAEDSQASV